MSAQEDEERPAVAEEAPVHDYIELKTKEEVEALEPMHACAYIEKLHEIIRKYDKKIAVYKQKLKPFMNQEIKSYDEKGTQVEIGDWQSENNTELVGQQVAEELSATDAFSFVDEMRKTAKHAENLKNMIYEPTSGMYYDPKTSYYYNAEYGLYYDGNTGNYLNYNHTTDSYEFYTKAQGVDKSSNGGGDEQQKDKDLDKDGDDQNEDEDDDDDEVEFDEHGGVITDKKTLKKIKAKKRKIEKRAAKAKRKSKKKHKKKQKKKDKERRRKERKRSKRGEGSDDNNEDDEDHERNSKRARKVEVEDGELTVSTTSSSSSESCEEEEGEEDNNNADGNVPMFKAAGRFQDIAKKYPPSLRIIVQETHIDQLTVGSLHLITYKGGSLGREGAHDVIIPDLNVSKCHLNFHYDIKQGIYKCRDLGSRNGTVLNGTRMSESKAASDAVDLVHGSVITLGQTKLLCHIHEGNSTCGLCEPGLLIETPTSTASTSSFNANTTLSHKEQLKKLQKKYGLENEKFVESTANANPNYNDRSAQRRIKVGSSTDKEKTEVACVNTEIASSNKGFKMLSKLGWQKGDTLGKSNQGLLAPINVVANEGTTGLGSSDPPLPGSNSRPMDKRKLANLKITQARYQQANDIFKLSEDSE